MMRMSTTTVETSRLILRLPEAADAGDFLEIHQDPEVMKRITLAAPQGGITVAWRNVALMIGHWQIRGYGQWAVVEKESGRVIGSVGLYNPEGWPGVELGWLVRRSHWGFGFATEASAAALNWAWRFVEADHIISLISPDNVQSIRIARKIGEEFEQSLTMDNSLFHQYGIHRP
jgi:RimJ/RimL family protein N-acetyltransferase